MNESFTNKELRKEAALVGINPNLVKPYNLAGRYGCEYYLTQSEIYHEVLLNDYYFNEFPKEDFSAKPRDLIVRENIFSRVKRCIKLLRNTRIGGDGSGGGKLDNISNSRNDPSYNLPNLEKCHEEMSSVGVSSFFKPDTGGDGGGGGPKIVKGNIKSNRNVSEPNSMDSMNNLNESYNHRLGVDFGGDMGGGGLKDDCKNINNFF